MAFLNGAPRALWIQHSCIAGASLWFRGNPPFNSETRHMFFVLGRLNNDDVVMVNATSQVSKRLHHLGERIRRFNLTAQDVSVRLTPGTHNFIKKDTVIDCSMPFLLNPKDLMEGDEFALFDEPPAPPFFEPLLKAWAASPFTRPAHLEQVRPQWVEHGIIF
ncbi:hypothetical protein F7230_05590 [Corynebacterium sp. 320]|uniref:hypothetical protein n=1 Tax=Corynebacterium TaxID=1716 RepID=UPI00125CB3AC|nr:MULTISPECIES: hypothetical protein [Corynebacterium]KAB1503020.1 hypothetical protein F7230_05590 [Corynebacterium sp. 320]KAB1550771.1 hypothetical protein F7233_09620 [Corynebacterium sp. 321]KAB1551128.1 hypothetical protein F7232_08775 [Corynebacterium sp. 319]KAB3526817.1 hypothetical protein F8354_05590 [Corynebacterium sp. 250]KAB3538310.1 hypothetical protein F8390_08490 [Corynebacterium sp. 366]